MPNQYIRRFGTERAQQTVQVPRDVPRRGRHCVRLRSPDPGSIIGHDGRKLRHLVQDGGPRAQPVVHEARLKHDDRMRTVGGLEAGRSYTDLTAVDIDLSYFLGLRAGGQD